MTPAPKIGDFQSTRRKYLRSTKTVYQIGTTGPGIVLMHDVPGITPNVLRLASILADRGFRVALPSLFGSDGASISTVSKAVSSARMLASSNFTISPEDSSSAVVDWLREFAKALSKETNGPIGAIGLGVTGAFALSLTVGTDGLVVASVLSNTVVPSILADDRETNLTAIEKENIEARRPATLALRFTGDPLCGSERIDQYEKLVGDRLIRIGIASPDKDNNIGKDAHSVLTEDLSLAEGHPTFGALTSVVEFLQAHLAEHTTTSVDVQPIDKLTNFADVFRHELKVILNVDLPAQLPGTSDEVFETKTLEDVDALDQDLSALCLSGGGIRSATFALGVMQGLARFKLLGKFHYLSSVSGGGYIAGWLSTWRALVPDGEVIPALNRSMETGKEPVQITGIRKDSNYITPQLGLLSADTWTIIALYIRNLLLNWLIFAPFFLGCFMIPRLCVAVLRYAAEPWDAGKAYNISRLVGALLVLAGLSVGIYGRFRKASGWLTDTKFQWLVLFPLVLSGASFTVAAVVVGVSAGLPLADNFSAHHLRSGAVYGALIYFFAWVIGRLSSFPTTDKEERKIEKRDVFYWTLSGALVGLLATTGMSAIAALFTQGISPGSLQIAETLGLSGFVLAYLVGELLYVGISSFSAKGDMDREWLARSSGWLSATAVLWTMYSAITLYAPGLLMVGWAKAVAAVGGISGLVTTLLGSSSRTGATKALQSLKNVPVMRIVAVAAILFALALASMFAYFDELIDTALTAILLNSGIPIAALDTAVILGCVGFAFLVSRFINVNRFSLHALYRNRLVRAFVGSARGKDRKPDPFTRFDPKDNLALTDIRPKETANGNNNLFHVINAALNVVKTDNEAWQERKAESFTMTRLFCGNEFVGYRPSYVYGGKEKRGLTLGTAMAISGAAVSPNQGYNSSPLTGFLLMLFNIRLGWWLGSPMRSSYDNEGPTFSLTPALRELGGATTDKSKWIYLSDGGHFENLGLYEMVRRRCRNILVSDAGCDPTCSFEDLGNAVRKIFIDFGVSINFEKLEIKARKNPPSPGIRFAVGTIKYPGSEKMGWLLYLKPTYMATDERADIRSYASANPQFPHESTTDQWFSESQLESYRALGASVTEYVCSGGVGAASGKDPEPIDFAALKSIADDLLKKKMAELDSAKCQTSKPCAADTAQG
jgi:dienelactone hydrolase